MLHFVFSPESTVTLCGIDIDASVAVTRDQDETSCGDCRKRIADQSNKFLWHRRLAILEDLVQQAQRDALSIWMMQHQSASTYQMYLIHDLTAPIERGSGVNTRAVFLAADAIDAAKALRRGGNSMVCYQFDQLVSVLREYVDHVKSAV